MAIRNGSRASRAGRALGRLGAVKGGKARAAGLSAERRSEIARGAALARHARARGEAAPPRLVERHGSVLDFCSARLAEIQEDDRFQAPAATVEVNAPLALIQVSLEAQHQVLVEVLRLARGKHRKG